MKNSQGAELSGFIKSQENMKFNTSPPGKQQESFFLLNENEHL